MAVPKVEVGGVVGDERALDRVRAAVIPAVGVWVVPAREYGLGLSGEMSRVGLHIVAQRDEIVVQWHLPNTRPVAAEVQVWLSACDDDRGVDSVGGAKGVFAGALASACLDDGPVICPVTWAWVIGYSDADGAVAAAGLRDAVVDVELAIQGDGVGGPGGSAVTLWDDGVCVQGIAESCPWAVEAGGGVDGDVGIDAVGVVCVSVADNAGIVDVQVGSMGLREGFLGGWR